MSAKTPTPKAHFNTKIITELKGETIIHENLNQEVLIISRDKLKLILNDFLDSINKSREWVTYLALFITLIASILTGTFNDFILSKDVWKAIFIICAISSFVLLANSLRYIKNGMKVEDVLNVCRGEDCSEE